MGINWEGEDRREKSRDHDLLLEMKGILLSQNEVMKSQKESLDNHVDSFKKHVEEDRDVFKILFGKIGELQKYVWIGIGIITAVEFASKFIGK